MRREQLAKFSSKLGKDFYAQKNRSAQQEALRLSNGAVNVKAAADFYQKAFGFTKRGIMNGPDGKAMHAELTLRGSTVMLGPEMPQMGSRGAKTLGASPTTLYLLTDNVDKTVAKAVKLGATLKGSVMDMFWGDRCGTLVDPEGYMWMVATHIAEPTPKEMQQKMKEQMASQQAAKAASAD